MKLFWLTLILLAVPGCLFPESIAKERENESVETGVGARAVDGDTFETERGERVRLIGIDTPEKGMPCFEEAKNRLQELLFGKRVLMSRDVSERDKYGRLVRFVYVENQLVNLVLVEEGLALAFDFEPDTSKSSLFREAELRAADGNGCLWRK